MMSLADGGRRVILNPSNVNVEQTNSSKIAKPTNEDSGIVENNVGTVECVNLWILKDEEKSVTKRELETGKGTNALCFMCGKAFFSNYNLKRHMTSCKLCPDEEKSPRYQCQCGRTYTQEWDLKKHKSSCQDSSKKCKKCPFCHLLFYHRLQLQAHMKSTHNVTIQEPEILRFDSIDDFKVWKERVEEDTFTYYSKQTGSNVTGVSVNTYYVCQHDGSDRIHSTAPRKTERRNRKGRVKTGRLCWSQMNVKEFRDGSVQVTYHPSHTHSITAADTKHHPLPPSITNEIERRLTELKDQSSEDDPDNDKLAVKKPRKKNYSVSVRSLRALARKNRKLFRITAEAIKDSEDKHIESTVEQEELGLKSEKEVTEERAEVVVEEETSRSTLLPNPADNCIWFCHQLQTFCESGRLSAATLSQVENVLESLVDNCRQDIMKSEVMNEESELAEVHVALPASATDSHSAQPNTIYQVVTLAHKQEAVSTADHSENTQYQKTVQLVGHREFIIITNDLHSLQSQNNNE